MCNKFENLEIKVIFIEENEKGELFLPINCIVFAKVRQQGIGRNFLYFCIIDIEGWMNLCMALKKKAAN